jgi:hypothetical protein
MQGMTEHCYFTSAGELRAIIGDDTDHGAGSDGHSGLWYLASTREGHSAVSRGYGVLLFGHHRGTGPAVERVDETTVVLSKEASEANNFVETKGIYRVKAPCYIDYEMTATARDGHKQGDGNLFSWCCYVNSPAEKGIHFIQQGLWTYYYNPVHGQGAMVFPTDLAMNDREPWGRQGAPEVADGRRNFSQSDSGRTFDHPFYFGMIRGMMFQLIADDYLGFRFYISPSGAGPSLIPGEHSPAWDFGWQTGPLEVVNPRTLHVRLIYKRPEPTDEIPNGYAADHAWMEYERFKEEHPQR